LDNGQTSLIFTAATYHRF